MILSYNSLKRFLDNLTPTMAKGSVLQLHLNKFFEHADENKQNELQKMLSVAEKEKKCQILHSFDNNCVFLYFSENYQDDILALLIKIQFSLGVSFDTNFKQTSNFYTLYRIKDDLEKLKKLSAPEKTPSRPTLTKFKSVNLTPVLPETRFSVPFTPTLLGQLEKSLAQADLSNLMRRQSVCALVGNAKPVELFEEIYVALTDLKKALCPTVDIYQSPWLLDRLLETLDKRVLENMAHHDGGAFQKNFSINIAVKTILSADFQAFDKSIAPQDKHSILLEIKQHDIFSNLSAFLAAKSFVTEQGYRLCIDMISGDSLQLVDRKKLGADFIKLMWSESLLEEAQKPTFIKALKVNDPSRIILCRVDDKRAIELGQILGLSLYQGYYIQKLLYQIPRPKKT